MIHRRKSVLVACASLMAAACGILPPVETVEADGRQGEEVSEICVGSKATRWSKFDRSSIILAVEQQDFYRIELEGCEIRRFSASINLVSNPGSDCLEASAIDETNSCVVRKINRWIPRAAGPVGALSTAYNGPRGW